MCSRRNRSLVVLIGSELVEQATPAQLREHLEPIAASPARREHAAAVTVAQRQAPSAVQRAAAAPSAALLAGLAERMGDFGGAHLVLLSE